MPLQVKNKDDSISPLASPWRINDQVNSIMKLLEKINISDDLVLEVWDRSQIVAPNTTKVELVVKTTFEIIPSYFNNAAQFEQVKAALGMQIDYEYRMERPLVNTLQKDDVIEQLLGSFRKNMLPYFSRPDFSRSFVLAKYRDIKKKLQRPAFVS
jgi:hypothetical protein